MNQNPQEEVNQPNVISLLIKNQNIEVNANQNNQNNPNENSFFARISSKDVLVITSDLFPSFIIVN